MKLPLMLVLLALTASADPCQQPLRIFDGQRVQLQPLFTWWTNSTAWQKTNARPLRAWVRVTGTLEKNAGLGWVVQATLETAPGVSTQQPILLMRPPFSEAALFADATAQRAALQSQAAAQRQAASANSQRAAAYRQTGNRLNQLANDAPSLNREVMPTANQAFSASAQYSANAARARQSAQNLSAAADAQTERLPEHLRTADSYAVDLFALRTGKIFNGLPVYDPGMMR